MNGYDRLAQQYDQADMPMGDESLADPDAEALIWQVHEDHPDYGPLTVVDEVARRGTTVTYGQVRAVLG